AVGPTPLSHRWHDGSTSATCQHDPSIACVPRVSPHRIFFQQPVATTRLTRSVANYSPTPIAAVSARPYLLFPAHPASEYHRRRSHPTAAADSDLETLHRPPAGSAHSSPSHQAHHGADDAATPLLKRASRDHP